MLTTRTILHIYMIGKNLTYFLFNKIYALIYTLIYILIYTFKHFLDLVYYLLCKTIVPPPPIQILVVLSFILQYTPRFPVYSENTKMASIFHQHTIIIYKGLMYVLLKYWVPEKLMNKCFDICILAIKQKLFSMSQGST